MRILLVNLHSSRNAGDDVLTSLALQQLREQFPGSSFTLAMNDPRSYSGKEPAVDSFTSLVKPIRTTSTRWRWRAVPALAIQSLLAVVGFRLTGRPWHLLPGPERRALLQSYFEADLVISAAGNFLYTSGRVGISFLLALFTIFYAQLAGKPTYTLPQTLGPIRRPHENWLAKLALTRMRLVLLRDPISQQVWDGWEVPHPQGLLHPDLAFAQPVSTHRREAVKLLKRCGLEMDRQHPRMGVTAIQWGAQSRAFDRQAQYEDALTSAIRDFLGQPCRQVVLFSQVQGPTPPEDDRLAARRIREKLEDLGDRVFLIDQSLPAPVLKAAYGQMDLFLGTRLHSNIFALTEGVPVVAIGYQYKTRGIMRMLDLERWVLDIEQVGADNLLHLLREAWAAREQTRSHIQAVLPQIREQACTAGALIAADYRSLCDKGKG
jgi:colanic acid/amylovoran biosynthesis protein